MLGSVPLWLVPGFRLGPVRPPKLSFRFEGHKPLHKTLKPANSAHPPDWHPTASVGAFRALRAGVLSSRGYEALFQFYQECIDQELWLRFWHLFPAILTGFRILSEGRKTLNREGRFIISGSVELCTSSVRHHGLQSNSSVIRCPGWEV